MKPTIPRVQKVGPPRRERRPAGRSFDDPRAPLGARLFDRDASAETGQGDPERVAKRAKAVAILRKADEFMRLGTPAPTSPEGMVRALELAAERMGLGLSEYDTIVSADPELIEIERKVLEDARRRC